MDASLATSPVPTTPVHGNPDTPFHLYPFLCFICVSEAPHPLSQLHLSQDWSDISNWMASTSITKRRHSLLRFYSSFHMHCTTSTLKEYCYMKIVKNYDNFCVLNDYQPLVLVVFLSLSEYSVFPNILRLPPLVFKLVKVDVCITCTDDKSHYCSEDVFSYSYFIYFVVTCHNAT